MNYLQQNSPVVNRLRCLASVLVVLVCSMIAVGQVPMRAKDNKSAVNASDFERINLYDGQFSFNLPLASIGGRGVGNGMALNLESNWRREEITIGYSGSVPNVVERIDPDPYALNGMFPQAGGYLLGSTAVLGINEILNCSNETRYRASGKSFSLNFVGFGGQSATLFSQSNDGDHVTFTNQGCSGVQTAYVGTIFLATDGSGTKFIADSAIGIIDEPMGEGQGHSNIYPSGMLRFPDGTSYRIDGGLVSWIQDRNGNRTTLTNTGFSTDIRENRVTMLRDPLLRQITTSTDPYNQYVSYSGTGGASRSIRIGLCNGSSTCFKTGETAQYLHTLFPWIPIGHYSDRQIGPGPIKEAELPNGQKYRFYYNRYSELARVELPTGGAIEYDYETVGNYSTQRRIVERRVYSNGTSLDNRTVYEYSDSIPNVPGNTIPSERWTKVKLYQGQSALHSTTKHFFWGCTGSYCQISNLPQNPQSEYKYLTGREFRSEITDSGGTLLRKSDTLYEARRRLNWTNAQNPPWVDYRVTEVKSTLADSNQVSKTIYGYNSSVPYNLESDVYEHDFGSGQPGNLIRQTHTDYETSSTYTNNNVHILNLPTQKSVFASTSSYTTTFEYDNYASGSTSAPLIDRSNITGHDSNIGTSYTTRGNVTKVTTGGISTYSQYDTAGNVVKTIDGKGYADTIDYSDRYGSANVEAQSNSAPAGMGNSATYAYPTKLTNRAGWISYVQRDFYTGAVVDSEDANGNISTTYYNDPLDRPKQTVSNSNRAGLSSQASVDYDDIGRKVTVTADSLSSGDNLIKTEAIYDGFGRTTESRDYEGGSSYITTLSEYDSLGRPYRVSNPFRSYAGETAVYSTTGYDTLGRVNSVTTPDGATVSKGYSGSTVSVTDQAGRSRSGYMDAIGRLKQVTESGYVTDYVYDVAGRMRKSTQTWNGTTQNRYFMYDDAGRLIRAKQVEQDANPSLSIADPVTNNSNWSVAYAYDNNGNITSTTDALGRTIGGNYDNLNRLTYRQYYDSTPSVTFTYDDSTIPNSRGKLTSVSSSVGATNYTSFDYLGRVKSSSQSIGPNTYNFPDYTYNVSGALISQIYPSGRVVATNLDAIGRLSSVTSQVTGHAAKTMISDLTYTSFGAVKQSKLGNGNWETAQFDNLRMQVKQIGLGASVGETNLLKLEFDYGTTNNNGSLLQQKIKVPGITQIIQNYSYDSTNRLESATETISGNSTVQWKQTFAYDAFGNRRFDAANTTTFGSCPQNVCNPDLNRAKNQFSTADGYNYNAEGNLISNPESQTFTYDSENRQTQVSNSATQSTATYQYDGNGKRVKKSFAGEDTYFVYDAFGKLVAEYVSNQAVTFVGTQYLTQDQLGSPRVVTNALGGVSSRRDFMPFGEEISAGPSGRASVQGYGQPDNARQKFTGYERDSESGMDFAQNRYYSNRHGRFTSVDPLAASASIKAPQSLNRYSYGNNNPYKFADPLGLSPCGISGTNSGSSTGRTCNQQELYGGREDSAFGKFTEGAEADFDQRLANTNAAAAANRAIAGGDQDQAEAICAANPGIECQGSRSTVSVDAVVGSNIAYGDQESEKYSLLGGYLLGIEHAFGERSVTKSGTVVKVPVAGIVIGFMDAARELFEVAYDGAFHSKLNQRTLGNRAKEVVDSLGSAFGGPLNTFKGISKNGRPVTRYYGKEELRTVANRFFFNLINSAIDLGLSHQMKKRARDQQNGNSIGG